jgi:hypothetical protein
MEYQPGDEPDVSIETPGKLNLKINIALQIK